MFITHCHCITNNRSRERRRARLSHFLPNVRSQGRLRGAALRFHRHGRHRWCRRNVSDHHGETLHSSESGWSISHLRRECLQRCSSRRICSACSAQHPPHIQLACCRCVIRGCVPKKLLVYGAHVAEELKDAAGFGWTLGEGQHDWSTLVKNKVGRMLQLHRCMKASAGRPQSTEM